MKNRVNLSSGAVARAILITTSSCAFYDALPIIGRINQAQVQRTLPSGSVLVKNAVPTAGGQIKSINGIQRGGFGTGRGSSGS